MPLPSTGIVWKNYRISTPTFKLTPVEKPDSSPFLIHMTGRNSLVRILNGENAGDGIQIPENHGFIRSSIPSFDNEATYYTSRVVCFTESPVFALDFFRYRSYRRWDNNQQYGIGFSKEFLIHNHGVRPVVYLDTHTNSRVLALCNKAENDQIIFAENPEENVDIKDTLKKLKPLLFPLLETQPFQGFMWEREWRYPYDTGLIFPHQSIKVICCPNSERAEIEELLGDQRNEISIVESWREYDEVTNYLKRRSSEYNLNALNQIEQINDLTTLRNLKERNDQTLNSLSAYYEVFKGTVNRLEGGNIHDTIEGMKAKSTLIGEKIKHLEEEIKAKEAERKAKEKLKS